MVRIAIQSDEAVSPARRMIEADGDVQVELLVDRLFFRHALQSLECEIGDKGMQESGHMVHTRSAGGLVTPSLQARLTAIDLTIHAVSTPCFSDPPSLPHQPPSTKRQLESSRWKTLLSNRMLGGDLGKSVSNTIESLRTARAYGPERTNRTPSQRRIESAEGVT